MDGSLVNPQPFPDSINISAHEVFGIDLYEHFNPNIEVSLQVTSSIDTLIGHNEIVGVIKDEQNNIVELVISGEELDRLGHQEVRYFVPYCIANSSGSSYVIIKNISNEQNSVTLNYYDIDGNFVGNEGIDLSAMESYKIEYKDGNPANEFSIEIESTAPLSIRMARYDQISADDYTYDSVLGQYF